MEIKLNFDTAKMTKKEELLDAQYQLQTALDAINKALKTAAKAEHLHLEDADSEPETFFGINFDFRSMSKEALESHLKTSRQIMTKSALHLENFLPKRDSSKRTFWGVEFDFSNMSKDELSATKEEAKHLVAALTHQIESR